MGVRKSAIQLCAEEECASFIGLRSRRAEGWEAGGIGCSGIFLGILSYSRSPKRFVDEQERFIGAMVEETESCFGSYGMGGPGFLGLRMGCAKGSEWIVYRLWAAVEWLRLDGRLFSEGMFPKELQAVPKEKLTNIEQLHGCILEGWSNNGRELILHFRDPDNSGGRLKNLSLRRDGANIPPWRGNGEKKMLAAHDSLDDVLIVSVKADLWLE